MILHDDNNVENDCQKKQDSSLTAVKDIFHKKKSRNCSVFLEPMKQCTQNFFQEIGIQDNSEKCNNNRDSSGSQPRCPILRQVYDKIEPCCDNTGDHCDGHYV